MVAAKDFGFSEMGILSVKVRHWGGEGFRFFGD